jgi:hypothetical protein
MSEVKKKAATEGTYVNDDVLERVDEDCPTRRDDWRILRLQIIICLSKGCEYIPENAAGVDRPCTQAKVSPGSDPFKAAASAHRPHLW